MFNYSQDKGPKRVQGLLRTRKTRYMGLVIARYPQWLQKFSFLVFFFFWQLLVSVVSQLTMELGTIRALSCVLELLRYKWQILSFVRCQNIEMKDWSKLSQNSYGLKRITWISDGVIQFLTNILTVSHFNPVKPAAQRQRYPCGKNPDWNVPPFIQGVVPHEFWEMINGIKKFKSDWSRQED